MGERGPARKPTNLILLRGNPGHLTRASLQDEPRPEAILPPPPREMTGIAKREWLRITEHLYDVGLITHLDIMALKIYCDAVQTYETMRRYIKRQRVELDDGTVLKGEIAYLHGRTAHKAPHFLAMKRAQDTIVRMCAQFGMTPSARSRMHVSKPVKATATETIDEFIAKGR